MHQSDILSRMICFISPSSGLVYPRRMHCGASSLLSWTFSRGGEGQTPPPPQHNLHISISLPWMAQVGIPTESASEALCTYGFFGVRDAAIGDRVQEKQSRGFPCLSEEGLEFLSVNFLNDARILDPIKNLLPKCAVARYREFQSDRDHVFQFRKGGETKPKVFVCLLWKPGAEVIFYGRSHQHKLASVIASNGLFEVPLAALEAAGCNEPTLVHFEHGGLTIHDARTCVEFRKTQPVAAVFGAQDILARWGRMDLAPDLAQKVLSISNQDVWLHTSVYKK